MTGKQRYLSILPLYLAALGFPAWAADLPYTKLVERKYCASEMGNEWLNLLNRDDIGPLAQMAKSLKLSEAPYLWCAIRIAEKARYRWWSGHQFYDVDNKAQFLATVIPTYMFNDPDVRVFTMSDEAAMELFAKGITELTQGAIAACSLKPLLILRDFQAISGVVDGLGENHRPIGSLECEGETLIEIASTNGLSENFGKLLMSGNDEFSPPPSALVAAARTGSLNMLKFLLQYEYSRGELEDAVRVAGELPEPIRTQAIAAIERAAIVE